jgi:uncharacterized phiE125 gp8 family phage protein
VTYPLTYTGSSGIYPTETTFPSGPPLPQVSLADIKTLLRKTDTKDDDELVGYLDAAATRIAEACIPLGPATVVDTFDGEIGAGTLILSQSPVNAITSVTVYGANGSPTAVVEAGGATGQMDGYRKNLSAGTLRRIGYRTWPRGWGNIEVTYTVGPAATPPEAYQAVRITVQVWWESRRISGNLRAPGGTNSEPGDAPEPTFGIPVDAYDLLLGYLKPPRIA